MDSKSRFRKAIGRVKDHTSIGLARVGSSTSLPDLDIAIVRATSHEDCPPEERYIQEILSLTAFSQAYVASCITTISRRLDKTKNWVVALKTLILIHHLLQDGDPAYEKEIFFATRRGTRLLNMSDFRDMSRPNAWDYSAFVRTYALYLDEQLEYRMQRRRQKQEPGSVVVNNHHLFSKLQHLAQVLERFLACRPTGPAKNNQIVMVALNPAVRQSFQLYYDITDILRIFMDRLAELEISESVKVYEILRRVGKQYEELDCFYGWCKCVGLVTSSEYPEVQQISENKLDEVIREKSVMEQSTIEGPDVEEAEEEFQEPELELEPELEPDMNAIKALPGPEGSQEEKQEEDTKELKTPPDEGDLLDVGNDAPPSLSNQQPSLPGGFSPLHLDGMYQQQATEAAMANSGMIATGSASSVAFGSAGRPAPPSANGRADPFSASLPVAPPPYVQMAEMEKKQRLLVEEQMMWQQNQRNGLQGQ